MKGFIINDYLMGIINVGRSQIDKLIIAPLLGFALLGNYSLALQVVMGLTIFPNVIFKFLLPEEAEKKSHDKKTWEEVETELLESLDKKELARGVEFKFIAVLKL